MKNKFYIFTIFFVIFFTKSIKFVLSNEAKGCGGFVKSHVDIDFSKIEIKLLTKQGSEKERTDCSPSNGYYFIPVYDKGEYILKISPPPGWSFEPEFVNFSFNGETDICSQGKDVNFVFKGFGITGKVYLNSELDKNISMKNVHVELISENGLDLRKTITDSNGVFSFTPITPGKYKIKAARYKWYFSKSELSVIVEDGKTELPENSLVVAGFNVEGKIFSSGQKVHNINIALFKEKNQKLRLYCENNLNNAALTSLTSINSNYYEKPVCSSLPSKNGSFVFNGVAPGKYIITPVVDNKDIKLNIEPKFIEFSVEKDAVNIKDTFEIVGCSVSGKILTSPKGRSIPDVTVELNENLFTKTDKNGQYTLDNVKTGFYTLKVKSDSYSFNEEKIEISLLNPSIPNIMASGYKVCGQVISEKSHTISITNEKGLHFEILSDPVSGSWCKFLSSGEYYVKVLTSESDKSNGIQFFPLKQKIDVIDSPISGIVFSQLKVTLTGVIKCLPDSSTNCKNIQVTLHSLDSTGSIVGDTLVVNAENGKYEFKNILPGPYELSIPRLNLCWATTKTFLNVMNATETAPPFIHKGYEVSIVSSHRAKMYFSLKTKQKPSSLKEQNSNVKTMNLMSGGNTFCVDNAGEYSIELVSCHKYDTEKLPKTFSTNDKNPTIIKAISHKTGIRILSTESNINTFKVQIETKSGKEIVELIKESQKIDGYHSYYYSLYLRPDEVILLKPLSDTMLFKPESKEITGGNDCIDVAFSFIAIKGLIITGKTIPPIKDVNVKLSFPKHKELLALSTLTTSSGEFKFGPIDSNIEYNLKAEKESYIFSEYDRKTNSFKAHKLCEIIVTVKDELGNKLSGVLLSLSGAESYRKNLVIGDNGTIKFHSLSPSQYFLRPMMKEYKFNPNSKLIDVKSGEAVNVELTGNRVAFSVFGKITTLSDDVFPNVVIEAVSEEKCMNHQEEAASEKNGQYRIRGLQPDCTYVIKPKQENNINTNIERTIPSSRTVKIDTADVRGINLVALNKIGVVDIMVKVFASSIDYYKTLQISLYSKADSDNLLYTERIDTPLKQTSKQYYNPGIMVFFPRIPLDNNQYTIELTSTISNKIYDYNLAAIKFTANTSSLYFELNFQPELKTNDNELNQNSLSALILVSLLAIAFFRQDLVVSFINFMWNQINELIQNLMQRDSNKKKTQRHNNETINYKEIEQLAEGINSIKKKKIKKI